MYSRGNPLDRVSAEALLDSSVALESAWYSLQEWIVQLKQVLMGFQNTRTIVVHTETCGRSLYLVLIFAC